MQIPGTQLHNAMLGREAERKAALQSKTELAHAQAESDTLRSEAAQARAEAAKQAAAAQEERARAAAEKAGLKNGKVETDDAGNLWWVSDDGTVTHAYDTGKVDKTASGYGKFTRAGAEKVTYKDDVAGNVWEFSPTDPNGKLVAGPDVGKTEKQSQGYGKFSADEWEKQREFFLTDGRTPAGLTLYNRKTNETKDVYYPGMSPEELKATKEAKKPQKGKELLPTMLPAGATPGIGAPAAGETESPRGFLAMPNAPLLGGPGVGAPGEFPTIGGRETLASAAPILPREGGALGAIGMPGMPGTPAARPAAPQLAAGYTRTPAEKPETPKAERSWVEGLDPNTHKRVITPLAEAQRLGLQDIGDVDAKRIDEVRDARQVITTIMKRGDPTGNPKNWGIDQLIDSLDADHKLGVAASRINSFLAGKVGHLPDDDPRIGILLDKGKLAMTLSMKAHFGASGGRSPAMLQHFLEMADARKMDAVALRTGFEAIEDYMLDRGELPQTLVPDPHLDSDKKLTEEFKRLNKKPIPFDTPEQALFYRSLLEHPEWASYFTKKEEGKK
jgi:hypothetical protein